MELQVLRNNVDVERLVGEAMEQTVVEGEVALPGGIRDEARVLHTDARLVLASAEAQTDRLGLDGTVVFQILYTQGDNTPRALEANTSFTHWLEVPGAAMNMREMTTGRVLQASAHPAGGRLMLRAEVELAGRVFTSDPVGVITGVAGVQDLQSREMTLELLLHAGDGQATSLLREEYELPESLGITETLMAKATPQRIEITGGGEGRAMVEGNLLLEVFHASANADKPLVITRHTLPFEQSVDLGGATGDDLSAYVTVQDVAASSVDAGDGSRLLRTEAVLQVNGCANRALQVACLQDAYTLTGDALLVEQMPARCFASAQSFHDTQNEKMMVEMPDGALPIRNVLAAFVHPVLGGTQSMGDRQVAEGILETTVVYMPVNSEVPATVTQELPFRALFQGALPDDAWIDIAAQEVEASPVTSDRVEVQYKLNLRGETCGMRACNLPTGLQSLPTAASRGGMILVFPQADETMWDLARRFRVTQDSIERINPGLDTLRPDKGVLIYQRTQV